MLSSAIIMRAIIARFLRGYVQRSERVDLLGTPAGVSESDRQAATKPRRPSLYAELQRRAISEAPWADWGFLAGGIAALLIFVFSGA